MTFSVLAVSPAALGMASRFLRQDLVSARVLGGRGYLLVHGDVGKNLSFVDPIDNELLLETTAFVTQEAADAWIKADVAQRGRPA